MLGPRGNEQDFEASVVTPFSALLLPPQALSLITSLSSEELSFKIRREKANVQGAVDLTGLNEALVQLQASCLRP